MPPILTRPVARCSSATPITTSSAIPPATAHRERSVTNSDADEGVRRPTEAAYGGRYGTVLRRDRRRADEDRPNHRQRFFALHLRHGRGAYGLCDDALAAPTEACA